MNAQPPAPPDPTPDNPLTAEHLQPASAATQALVVLTIITGVVTGFGLFTAILVFALHPQSTNAGHVLALTGVLTLGLGVCGIFISGIGIIRRLDRLSDQAATIEQHTAIQAQQASAPPPVQSAVNPEFTELHASLARIQETLLLPDDLRSRRFEVLREHEHETRLTAAEKLANSNDFHRAREQLQALVERFGKNDRIQLMETQIEKQARAAEEMDIRHVRDRIKDLMALNQWDQAEQLTRELSEKHPQSPEPMAMFQHVCRERQLFEQRHRSRLYEEILQLANQRHWQDAAQAAHQFITTFPSGPDPLFEPHDQR